MKIWMALFVFVLAGCVGNPATASDGFKYKTITPGIELTIVIDPNVRRFWSFSDKSFDAVAEPLEICEFDSQFICFYQPNPNKKAMTFSVPRGELDTNQVWDANGVSFKVVKEISTPDCGANYIIESTKDNKALALFTFNYTHGLQIILFVDAVDTIQHEDDSADIYRFTTLYFVDGPGFGGSGTCASALVSK